MDSNSKIFVAGHKGLVGSAIVRNLQSKGYNNIITLNRSQLDLTKENDVYCFFMMERPEYVFNAAANCMGLTVCQQGEFLCVTFPSGQHLTHYSDPFSGCPGQSSLSPANILS